MDLTSPLRSLAPSLDSAVLSVLAGTESSLSTGQIADLAGRGTRQGVSLVVDRLAAHGLVTAISAGRGTAYALNRDHLLAESVLIACQARATLIERLAHAIGELDPIPLHASIFGSLARASAGADSDIDLLVVMADRARLDDRFHGQLTELADRVLAWTGNRLEVLAFTEEELQGVVERQEPIVQSWQREASTVFGAPVDWTSGRVEARSDHEPQTPADSRGHQGRSRRTSPNRREIPRGR